MQFIQFMDLKIIMKNLNDSFTYYLFILLIIIGGILLFIAIEYSKWYSPWRIGTPVRALLTLLVVMYIIYKRFFKRKK